VAVALKNVELIRQVESEAAHRANLQRFLSPNIVEQILNKKLTLELGGALRQGAVLFSDLVGFTAMSERLAPERIMALLNRYMQEMFEAIFLYEGNIDKMVGDAILAMWGAPSPQENYERHAVLAALAMHNRLFQINRLATSADEVLGMGIGIHAGSFVAGNIGSDQKMEYTIIGDTVNTASRIESHAIADMTLVSKTLFDAIRDQALALEMPSFQAKNKREPVMTYSLRGLKTAEHNWALSWPMEIDGLDAKGVQLMFDTDENAWKLQVALQEEMTIAAKAPVAVLIPEQLNLGLELTFTGQLTPDTAEYRVEGKMLESWMQSNVLKTKVTWEELPRLRWASQADRTPKNADGN